MANTYYKIATTTLGSNSGAIAFSNIPQTFNDLELRCSLRSTSANIDDIIYMTINDNSPASKHSITRTYTSGSAISTNSDSNAASSGWQSANGDGAAANVFAVSMLYFVNYSGTSYFKPFLVSGSGLDSGSTVYQSFSSGLFSSTSGINKISIAANSGTWKAGTTITLYGIKNT